MFSCFLDETSCRNSFLLCVVWRGVQQIMRVVFLRTENRAVGCKVVLSGLKAVGSRFNH